MFLQRRKRKKSEVSGREKLAKERKSAKDTFGRLGGGITHLVTLLQARTNGRESSNDLEESRDA